MALDRDALVSGGRRPIESLELPGLGPVCLRALTGAEVSEIHASIAPEDPDYGVKLTHRIVARTICDESGARLLLIADAEALFDHPAITTNPLAARAIALNRMGQADAEATKKGSGGTAG